MMDEGKPAPVTQDAEDAAALGSLYREMQADQYGCREMQCVYPHDGNCWCFNTALSRHRLASTPANPEGGKCTCMEVYGEDPGCALHGEGTEWSKANPDICELMDRLAASSPPASAHLADTVARPKWPEDAEFEFGQSVTTNRVPFFKGKIAGWYRNETTGRLGYDVEASAIPGLVHIYPESALAGVGK